MALAGHKNSQPCKPGTRMDMYMLHALLEIPFAEVFWPRKHRTNGNVNFCPICCVYARIKAFTWGIVYYIVDVVSHQY